jgi:hypothetical protein
MARAQARGNVDSIAEDVVTVDDNVADAHNIGRDYRRQSPVVAHHGNTYGLRF